MKKIMVIFGWVAVWKVAFLLSPKYANIALIAAIMATVVGYFYVKRFERKKPYLKK